MQTLLSGLELWYNLSHACLDNPKLHFLGVESIMRQKQVEMDTAFLISYVEMSDDITSDILSTTLHPEEKTAEAMPSSVKASVRLYSDDEIIVRLVNLHDTRAVTVSLTDADGNIPLLASLSSGAKIKAKPDSIREMSLSTIISKEQALREKFDVREAGQVNRSALLISSKSFTYYHDVFAKLS